MPNFKPLAVAILLLSVEACGGGSEVAQPAPDTLPDPVDPPPVSPPPAPDWFAPDCKTVTGEPVATLSVDAGITVLPNSPPLAPDNNARTFSISATDGHGGLLFASRETAAYMSDDAGCSWRKILEDALSLVTTGQWAYAVDAAGDRMRMHVFHADGHVGTYPLPFRTFAPVVSQSEPGVVYALSRDGEVWRSSDHAVTWVQQGVRTPHERDPYWLSINPASALHFVVTVPNHEPVVSFDGGQSWTIAEGLKAEADVLAIGAPIFGGMPENPDIWVYALRRKFEKIVSVETRVIARSTDGGLTFVDEVLPSDEVFFNHPPMATRGRSGELFFAGMGCPFYTPKLFRYSAADSSIDIIQYSSEDIHGIDSLDFHPTEDEILYMGLKAVGSCGAD